MADSSPLESSAAGIKFLRELFAIGISRILRAIRRAENVTGSGAARVTTTDSGIVVHVDPARSAAPAPPPAGQLWFEPAGSVPTEVANKFSYFGDLYDTPFDGTPIETDAPAQNTIESNNDATSASGYTASPGSTEPCAIVGILPAPYGKRYPCWGKYKNGEANVYAFKWPNKPDINPPEE